MSGLSQVHWHEGLFLQPHHLQAASRQVEQAAVQERQLSWPYPWGLIESRHSRDALRNMRIVFDSLKLVTRNGLVIHTPGNAVLPPLDIQKAFTASGGSLMIYLGIPQWSHERGNTLMPDAGYAPVGGRRLYSVDQVELTDENTGQNPQAVAVKKYNLKLMFENEDTTDLERIPLMRVVRSVDDEDGLPRVDPNFVPPCMLLTGDERLEQMFRDMAHQAEAIRSTLVARLKPGFGIESIKGGEPLRLMLKLQAFNVHAARLGTLARARQVTPLQAYLELRSLQGALAALYPDQDPYDVPDYDHENPLLGFDEVCRRIRTYGPPEGSAEHAMKLEFVRDDRFWVAHLKEEHFTKPNQWFLAIQTREEPRALAKLVEDKDRFKLMPLSLNAPGFFGIPLREERNPPMELPTTTGMNYFRLLINENARMWERVRKDGVMSADWPGLATSDFKLTLYMTTPVAKESS